MNEFLTLLSDTRTLIAIAVIVILLAVWLILHRVKTTRFRNDLKELESHYQLIRNVPVSFKMNKAVAVGKSDESSNDKVQAAKESFDASQSELADIASVLADAEELVSAGKLSKAQTLMSSLETRLAVADGQIHSLEQNLDEILARETAQRQEVTALKNKFRALKSMAQENASRLAFAWPMVEQKVTDTEKMFSTFEEWMYSNDFDKANAELDSIRSSIDELESMLDTMPALIEDARGVIPKMAETLHQDYAKAKKMGTYLRHLDVEKNLQVMNASLKEDMKKVKSGNTEGVREHLDDYKERIAQMDEQVQKEARAFTELKELKGEVDELVRTANANKKFVNEGYAKVSERYGMSSMEEELNTQTKAVEALNEKLPGVIENVRSYQVPATQALSALKELNRDYSNANDSLKQMRERIEAATGDEDRARKQLVKLQIIMNQMQVKIRKYKLPNISATYDEDMARATEYIHRLEDLINETPLNTQLLNSTLQEALNFIYQLYNNVNNVVGTVVMVENTIVFGNRYRSTYADIDSELTRSELCFRNGEYTQALQIAIATIEKIHPGNYESMIKENARSAA